MSPPWTCSHLPGQTGGPNLRGLAPLQLCFHRGHPGTHQNLGAFRSDFSACHRVKTTDCRTRAFPQICLLSLSQARPGQAEVSPQSPKGMRTSMHSANRTQFFGWLHPSFRTFKLAVLG